jgi:DHA3 family tetracycline resistance protein-like MFS transporter
LLRINRPDAYRVYLIFSGITSLCFTLMFVAMAIYRVQIVGMNPFQLVLVGTVLEITCFLFEVPTGVVADTYSRRVSVIAGIFLIGLGYTLEGVIPALAISLVAQVVAGIGYTFISGATEAWITDEVGEARAGKAFLQSAQIGSIMSIIGTIAGIGLATISVNLPVVLGSVGMMGLALLLIVLMTEYGFTPVPREDRTTLQAMRHTFTTGLNVVKGSKLLLALIVITMFFGAYSEGFDRLWEAHFLKTFTLPTIGALDPIVWFGILNLGERMILVLAAEILRRRVNTGDHVSVARALLTINWVLMLGMIAFGLAGNFAIAVAAYFVTATMRGVNGPLYAAWLNQNIESKVRATVFSITSQADAIGQIAGGPLLGLVATVFSLRTVMIFGAIIISPTLLLYRWTVGHDPSVARDAAQAKAQSGNLEG